MSHFTVLVAASDKADLKAKLAPYQENNMGDCPEQYLEFNDCTEEELGFWQKHVGEAFGDVMSDHWKKEHPDLVDVTIEENKILNYAHQWGDYKEHPEQSGMFGYWENPNAKWDWYAIGGRWSGLLKLKPLETQMVDTSTLPPCNGFSQGEMEALLNLYRENRDKFMSIVHKYKGKEIEILKHIQTLDRGETVLYPNGKNVGNGSSGVFNSANTDPGKADYALAGMVDWDSILQEQLDRKMQTYHLCRDAVVKARAILAHRHEPRQGAIHQLGSTSEVIRVNGTEWTAEHEAIAVKAEKLYRETGTRGDNCRVAYRTEEDWIISSLGDRIAAQEHDLHLWDTFEDGSQRFYDTEDEHRERFKGERLTYAIIDMDGKWSAKGDMGWFGMSGNEDPDFDEAFWQFVQSLPDNQRVYVVDCHI